MPKDRNHGAGDYKVGADLAIIRSTLKVVLRGVAAVLLLELVLGNLLWRLGLPPGIWYEIVKGLLISVLLLPILYQLVLRPVAELAAKQAALSAESRFRSIAQATKEGILILGLELKIHFANDAVERMFGYAKAELQGANAEILMTEETRAYVRQQTEQVRATGEAAILRAGPVELEAIRKGGERFPVEVSASALSDGGPATFVVIVRDVTQRKMMEELLKESEARFRMLANTVPAMLWLTDPEGRCTYVSQSWVDFTGRRLDEELGDGWTIGIHPDDSEETVRMFRLAVEGRKKFELEYRLQRASGEYCWILDRGQPRFSPDGSFAGHIGACFDVTERKQAEEALRASEEIQRDLAEQQKAILNALPMAVRIVEGETIVYANPADARLHGYPSPQDEIGVAFTQHLVPEEENRVWDIIRRQEEDQPAPKRYQVRRRRADGSEFHAECTVEIIEYEGRKARLNVIEDLTDRERLGLFEKLLPICCVCGKIRDDVGGARGEGAWDRLDHYMAKHSATQFSHTFCPECYEQYRRDQGLK